MALLLLLASVQMDSSVRQGEVLRVHTTAAQVEFQGRKVPVFDSLALVPVPVDQATGSFPVKFLGPDGSLIEQSTIQVLEGGYPEQNVTVTSSMKSLTPSPGEREAVDKLKATVTPTRLWKDPFTAPVRGCMNSPYGVKRLHNGQPTGRYHLGLDQRGATGTPVRAATGGIVRIARRFRLHGGTVGIDHGQGVTTMYIHLSKTLVKEGTRVKAGQLIGEVGSTGFANGPHLHWIVNVHGVSVNPLQWVSTISPCAPRR